MTEYTLRILEPQAHLADVEIRVAAVGDSLVLSMPSWTPGSYLLREFARNVQGFEALDSSGLSLGWRRKDKSSWEVDTASAGGPVTVRYRVYANELTVRTSHIDSSHAYLNGASTFLWVEGCENESIQLSIEASEEWRIATSLQESSDGILVAANYDELVDSPIEIGTHRSLAWEQRGVPHRWAIWPDETIDEGRLLTDTQKIVDACAEMFGGLPYDRYLFLLHVVPGGGGGLEHLYSTSLQVAPEQLSGEGYERLLALTAHEHFHVWLGKRIRPEPLGPFDYKAENYTRNLWVIEGFTTYYTDRILLRAGLITEARYLERLGESIGRLQTLPGRAEQSLEDSSFDTWIRFYRPDEHTPNSQVSYYQKGAMVALVLDLEIRRGSRGRKSLDDVMRILWERFGRTDTGFPEDRISGIQAIIEEVGGRPAGDLLARYVTTTDEIDFDRHLEAVGLLLEGESTTAGSDDDGSRSASSRSRTTSGRFSPPPAWEIRFGIRILDGGAGTLRVTHVLAGGPALEAGINSGDELVAIGGRRATTDRLQQLADKGKSGDTVELLAFRREQIVRLPLIIGPMVEYRSRLNRAKGQEGNELRGGWLEGAGEGQGST